MNYKVVTGTITYAIRGRDLLRKNGYNANMEKTKSGLKNGCGYSITVSGDIEKIERLLRDAGIKILEILEK
ncbi:MAG: DUF3343 domain-containing protein [Clostridia bacterium]|nr:DUF3343 domain-containing protein [Clostridia bacterium]MBQ2274149.1 DUF3343 domain-containing protein [Clostridia bacterium]